jgi:hypothetical protein
MKKTVSMIGKNLSFEEMQTIVKKKNLTLRVGIDRVATLDSEEKMIFQPYACISCPVFDYVKSFGAKAEVAFGKLKNRLLSGEVIDTGRGKKLQLIETEDGVELSAI